jgi:hypothetical protein
MAKPEKKCAQASASQLLFDFVDTPMQQQLHTKLKRSSRLWKLLFFISTTIALIAVVTMALMVKFAQHPTFLNDFIRWSIKPPPSRRHWQIPTVKELNEGKPILPIHSHNDYWRKRPLLDALSTGCKSVEADVWSMPGEDDLFVGHRWIALNNFNTLESLYTGPLSLLLDSVNTEGSKFGIFDSDPEEALLLYIDVKNDPEKVFGLLQNHLQPFMEKGYLTTYNTETQQWSKGPLTVIASGDVPVAQISAMTLRNVFIDAPLADLNLLVTQLHELNNTEPISSLSIMSSASLRAIAGSKGKSQGGLTTSEKESLKRAIDNAHDLGIQSRVWETPAWPLEQRDQVWRDLLKLGVDMINADDLQGAANL